MCRRVLVLVDRLTFENANFLHDDPMVEGCLNPKVYHLLVKLFVKKNKRVPQSLHVGHVEDARRVERQIRVSCMGKFIRHVLMCFAEPLGDAVAVHGQNFAVFNALQNKLRVVPDAVLELRLHLRIEPIVQRKMTVLWLKQPRAASVTTCWGVTAVSQLIRVVSHSYISARSLRPVWGVRSRWCWTMPATRNALVQELARSLKIHLLFLPSYSPNLNLIERVWKFVKKECLQSVQHASYEAFTAAIDNCLAKLKHDAQERHENPTRPQVSDV